MLEIGFVIFCLFPFLYWLGGLLMMPEMKPIQQELIRFDEEGE
tara:strand:+ start:1381 stop:1509 length:129 start_codon:yes stop_codon:yes gene_type:complete